MDKTKIQTLIEMRKENHTLTEIAERLEVTSSTVSYWIKKLKAKGVDVPKPIERMGRPGLLDKINLDDNE